MWHSFINSSNTHHCNTLIVSIPQTSFWLRSHHLCENKSFKVQPLFSKFITNSDRFLRIYFRVKINNLFVLSYQSFLKSLNVFRVTVCYYIRSHKYVLRKMLANELFDHPIYNILNKIFLKIFFCSIFKSWIYI